MDKLVLQCYMNHHSTFNNRKNKTTKSLVKTIATITLMVISLFFNTIIQAQENRIKTIDILEPDANELNISEIAEDIKYLPLSNDSPISDIQNVVYNNGKYFIVDLSATTKFLRFDDKGRLLNQIGKSGRGPGEYKFIDDFVIHPQTLNIYVIGGKPNQIMVYSPEGKCLKSIHLTKQIAVSIGISDNNLCLFYLDNYQHNEENMELLDTDGNYIKSYTNKYKFKRGRVAGGFQECFMYSLEGRLHFKEVFSDTIFYLNRQKIIPESILNSGERRLTPEVREKIYSEFLQNPMKLGKTTIKTLRPYNLFETHKYLFYDYSYDKRRRMLICDKLTNKKTEIDEKKGINNDWDGGPNIHLKTKKDENAVLSWINAYELKTYVASNEFKNSTPKYPKKKKALEQLANSLDENDNPVLMLVKLKE